MQLSKIFVLFAFVFGRFFYIVLQIYCKPLEFIVEGSGKENVFFCFDRGESTATIYENRESENR